ncbi:MAG: thiamine phosphate synthase, partial [Bacteroidetes bacterium]
ARLAIEGGADTIQFRQKTGGIRHVLHEARLVREVCRSRGVPLLIDDHLDVMLAVGAEGVHLGQTDLPIDVARSILGPEAIIGATATTRAQAEAACEAGASYIGFGPVFPTSSKARVDSVKGLDGLEEVCRSVPIPVIAIAGITPQRVRPVLQAGAHGIAVMTAITLADRPDQMTARFRRILDTALAS